MNITAYSFTSPGLERTNNEDAYLSVIDGNRGLFVVADGMGGHFGGEIASALLVNQMDKMWKNFSSVNDSSAAYHDLSVDNVLSELKKTIRDVNDELYCKYSKHGSICGTTFALMAVTDEAMLFINAGDTRIYSCCGISTRIESVDHVEKKIKENISLNESYDGRVTSAIGASREYKLDIKSRPIRCGTYLICSDGVYKYMTKAQLYIAMQCDDRHIGKYIEKKVTSHKAGDNYTYIKIEIKK